MNRGMKGSSSGQEYDHQKSLWGMATPEASESQF